ncbi:hypothetical protein PQX77_013733 [Marasmius sp. AFHP31]|nr:hypothetical protein PQX77_013733 [Marasmius sp. AFHP31]
MTSERDTIEQPPTPENPPTGPSNMLLTKTETKIETKTETPKGKERAAPGGEEPLCPGTPPDDLGGSDDEQGSDDGRSSDKRKLDAIHQTGELADIDKFNKVFNKPAGDSEHNDAGLKLFYKKAINPALETTIDKFEVKPTTLDGWQKAAVRKYNDWLQSKAEEKAWGTRKQITTTIMIRAANTSNAQQTGNTMSTSGGRLTLEERTTYMKEG